MNMPNMPVDIIDALVEPVFLIGGDRNVQAANHAARRLFGESIVGASLVRTIRHPEALQCVDAVLKGAETSEADITIARPIETIFRVRAVRLNPSQADQPQLIVTLNDISHIHDAEQMRSDFVANLSHELKSPLTALSGFIETLRGPARDDAQARDRFLDVMGREAERMNRLINDLLSLSKVEVKKRIQPDQSVEVVGLVNNVIHTLSAHPAYAALQVQLETPLTTAIVAGDADELVQVFHNLIENGLKYGASDQPVMVRMHIVPKSAGLKGPVLAITVEDKGAGIARAHIPRLTERFYRVDDHRSREKGGTGLGLAIVKHIVHRHRGRLKIDSVVGKGSAFTVLLPSKA